MEPDARHSKSTVLYSSREQLEFFQHEWGCTCDQCESFVVSEGKKPIMLSPTARAGCRATPGYCDGRNQE